MTTSRWFEGVVDIEHEHIKLFVGSVGTWSDNRLIAMLAPAGEQSFTVQFIADKIAHAAAVAEVTQSLNYYLIELGEKNPWAYAKYHCTTASNMYDTVHWALYKRSAS